MHKLHRNLLVILLVISACSAFAVNVRDFGAVGDGVEDDAVALQAALNQCAKEQTFCLAGRSWLPEWGGHGGHGGFSRHTRVGSYQPNAWGLYDMHGNVWEWCLNWVDDLAPMPATDPTGPMHGDIRVFRGGGWFGEFGQAQYCRSACRPFTYRGPYFHCADCGFRLATESLTCILR